jgi:hypothetical protein
VRERSEVREKGIQRARYTGCVFVCVLVCERELEKERERERERDPRSEVDGV